MPAYFPDRRTIIVVRAEYKDQANAAMVAATGNPAADQTFTSRLRQAGDATNTTVAYWCNWAMTSAHRTAVLAEIGNRFQRQTTPIPLRGTVRLNEPFWIFDAEPGQWTSAAVLSALGFAEPLSVE